MSMRLCDDRADLILCCERTPPIANEAGTSSVQGPLALAKGGVLQFPLLDELIGHVTIKLIVLPGIQKPLVLLFPGLGLGLE
jgi:hypothetical protein